MSNQKQHERDNALENVSERPFVSPYVDVFENEHEILVVADLPGVDKNDLSIRLEEGELTIEARRALRAQGTALATEYRPADFRRSFVLPQGIDRDKVDAHLAAGVLRLKLPKQAALRPRRIEVRAG
jgi:HSP20 family molecular chaperone IbpA